MGKRLTVEEFEKRANELHNCKYKYHGDYVKGSIEVTITCPLHGDFKQTPYHHLQGQGCPVCGREKNARKCSYSKEKFIEMAKKVHKHKYDYSEIEYVNSKTPINIICATHGVFSQTPDNHLRGHGCPRCALKYRNLDSFIEDSRKIHSDKLNYDNVVYNGVHEKVLLGCNVCGRLFWQTPHDNLSGKSCPHCRESKLERQIYEILNEKSIPFERWYRFDESDRRVSLDFYLPDHKIGIECQGEQHFRPVNFSGNADLSICEEEFERNIIRDKRKYERCKEIGIKLLYFVPKMFENCVNDPKLGNFYKKGNTFSKIEDILTVLLVKNKKLV